MTDGNILSFFTTILICMLLPAAAHGGAKPLNNRAMNQFQEVLNGIGGDIDPFIAKHGPPKWNTNENGVDQYGFSIRGCSFKVRAEGGKVTRVTLGIVAGKCDVQYGNRRVSELTVGSFFTDPANGQWQSNCLDCGNSGDPQITYVVKGRHAQGYVDTDVSTYEIPTTVPVTIRNSVGDEDFYAMRFDMARFAPLFEIYLRAAPVSDYGVGINLFR